MICACCWEAMAMQVRVYEHGNRFKESKKINGKTYNH